MKKVVLGVLISVLTVLSSCSLVEKKSSDGIYVLDWSREAVYRMDYDYNFYGDVVLLAGTAPTSMIIFNDCIYIANSGFGGEASLQSFSLKGAGEQKRSFESGSSPAFMAADEDYLYLTLWGSDELLVIDTDSLKIKQEIKGLKNPQSVLLDDNIIYVGSTSAEPDAKVYRIVKNTWTVDSVSAGSSPAWVVKSGSGIYALCTGDYDANKGKIVKIEGDTVEDITAFQSYPYRLYTNGTYFYALDYSGYIYRISSVIHSNVDSLHVPSPSALAFTNDRIVAGTNGGGIYLINLTTFTKADSVQTDFDVKTADFASY